MHWFIPSHNNNTIFLGMKLTKKFKFILTLFNYDRIMKEGGEGYFQLTKIRKKIFGFGKSIPMV